jgi:hypothetical protein
MLLLHVFHLVLQVKIYQNLSSCSGVRQLLFQSTKQQIKIARFYLILYLILFHICFIFIIIIIIYFDCKWVCTRWQR